MEYKEKEEVRKRRRRKGKKRKRGDTSTYPLDRGRDLAEHGWCAGMGLDTNEVNKNDAISPGGP